MRTKFIILILILCSLGTKAQEKLYIHQQNHITLGTCLADIEEITFNANGTSFFLNFADRTPEFPIADIDSLTLGYESNEVIIQFEGTTTYITNPLAFEGVDIEKEGNDVIVYSTTGENVIYTLRGTTPDGMFKVYSDAAFSIRMEGTDITNTDGPAINIQSKQQATITLINNTANKLTDGSSYTAFETEDMKGTFFSEGNLVFEGDGCLQVTALKKHAICSDKGIEINSGTITIANATGNALHGKDGIDINGGNINITVSTDTSKGLKSDGPINLTNGNTTITLTGNVIVENNDPSYCTGIKSDGVISISGGTLIINSSGTANKGISADGDINITNGTVQMTLSGNGGTYTNAENIMDSYSATCIKSDMNISILGGNITLTTSGTAGKGISADGTLTIGDTNNVPIINVTTTGKKFLVSGYGEDADYANPKAIKSQGDLTVNNGQITIKTAQDGGEGLESKATLTINGGLIEAETYDDAINAATAIVINGGRTYCYSSGNDGIDSNGTLTITGGIVISSGTTSPEEGFDCDQNRFSITGGIIIGFGGGTSSPTANACTQPSVIYSGSGTANTLIHVADASGTEILTATVPRSYQRQMTMLFSTPALTTETSYTLYTGGTYTNGDNFHGYHSNGTYSGGTQAQTFTVNSMVTNIGNSSGGGGWH